MSAFACNFSKPVETHPPHGGGGDGSGVLSAPLEINKWVGGARFSRRSYSPFLIAFLEI